MGAIRRIFQTMGFQDSMVKSYIDGMATKPSLDHIKLIEDFVRLAKPILLAKADVFYLGNINNSNDSFRNLVKDSHHGTIQGDGLVWDNLVGFTNPNGTGWVDTNYNPSTQGIKYTLNDAGAGVNKFNAPSTAGYVFNAQGSTSALRCLNTDYVINDATNRTVSSIPFFNGFHFFKRISATQKSYVNQNILNQLDTQNSISLPDVNVILFRHSPAIAGFRYLGGLNCFYVGASLTNAEYATLNIAINEYLIGCLFLKYGNDNWGVKMAKSYFYDLHGFEKYEAWEVYEFIKRHQSDYTYTPSELSTNSGVDGMTDWVDSNADGLADGWSDRLGGAAKSIVTGNGFTGNAQRLEWVAGTYLALESNVIAVIGRSYVIHFKYRSSVTFRLGTGTSLTSGVIAENTGDAIYATAYIVAATANYIDFYLSGVAGSWLEVDEVSIKEVTESDTVNFNKCLNSGFGLATDFTDTNSDGLADNWDEIYGSAIKSIVTGNGFTKKAQRIERAGTNGHIALAPSVNVLTNLTIGKNYTVYLKYRSNVPIYLFGATATIPANTGDAVVAGTVFTTTDTRAYFRALTVQVGDWFEISEVLIIDNSNTQYLHNVFGPNGLNRSIADYIMLFKAGGNLVANGWTKTGALLRWNHDAGITNSNTMPAYTRGSNLGIVTITSADGWDTLTYMNTSQTVNSLNSFYGNHPDISKIKTSGKLSAIEVQNRYKFISKSIFKDLYYQFTMYSITSPGYNKINMNDFLGGSYGGNYFYANLYYGAGGYIIGDMSQFTNEFKTNTIYIRGYNIYNTLYGLTGTLNNLVFAPNTTFINMDYSGITGGPSTHSNNIGTMSFGACKWSTQAILNHLLVVKNQLIITPPIKNLTLVYTNSPMGIVPANHQLILDIMALHIAAGFTATITVRTS